MAVSLSHFWWIPSGPTDLFAVRFFSLFSTIGKVTSNRVHGRRYVVFRRGVGSLSSCVVKTEANWLFRKFDSS